MKNRYFCNPLNFTYQYQFNQKEGGFFLNREAADPSMILFQGKYYILCGEGLTIVPLGIFVQIKGHAHIVVSHFPAVSQPG